MYCSTKFVTCWCKDGFYNSLETLIGLNIAVVVCTAQLDLKGTSLAYLKRVTTELFFFIDYVNLYSYPFCIVT